MEGLNINRTEKQVSESSSTQGDSNLHLPAHQLLSKDFMSAKTDSLPLASLTIVDEKHPGDKVLRSAKAIAQGTLDGIGESVNGIVKHPGDALKGMGIGLVSTGIMMSGARGGYLMRILPVVAGAAAAVEIAPKYDQVKAGLSGAWNGTMTAEQSAENLRPLGHLAVTYGIARGTKALATESFLKPALKLSGH